MRMNVLLYRWDNNIMAGKNIRYIYLNRTIVVYVFHRRIGKLKTETTNPSNILVNFYFI